MPKEKAKEKTIEEIYIESTRKLRTSLPKFVIFLGASFLIWMFGTALLIPLGKEVFIYDVEASKVINLIVVAAILVLIMASFKEIRATADACAGFVIFYVGGEKNTVSNIRVERLEGTFRSLAYVILVSLLFLMFKDLLEQVHPALSGLTIVVIVMWVIVALYSVVMALSSEVEEAARIFTEKVEKRLRKRRSLRK
jgi:hypothetical protein